MIIALQIFCIIVSSISFIGVVGEKDKMLKPLYLAGALGFTLIAVFFEISAK